MNSQQQRWIAAQGKLCRHFFVDCETEQPITSWNNPSGSQSQKWISVVYKRSQISQGYGAEERSSLSDWTVNLPPLIIPTKQFGGYSFEMKMVLVNIQKKKCLYEQAAFLLGVYRNARVFSLSCRFQHTVPYMQTDKDTKTCTQTLKHTYSTHKYTNSTHKKLYKVEISFLLICLYSSSIVLFNSFMVAGRTSGVL